MRKLNAANLLLFATRVCVVLTVLELTLFFVCLFCFFIFIFFGFSRQGFSIALVPVPELALVDQAGTHFVNQVDSKLIDPPASASQMLGLKACQTMPSHSAHLLKNGIKPLHFLDIQYERCYVLLTCIF